MKKEQHLKEFLRYTSLNVLGMLGLSCYILADTFFISKGLGSDGLTALNLALPVYSVINGCGLMLGMGGATRYAICRGQGAGDEGNRVFTCAVYAAVFLVAVFFVGGLLLSDKLAMLLGAKGVIEPMTDIYLKVILLFSPAFILNNILQCFVRNDGNPRLSMLAMLGGSICNIVLDYIFIFPLGMGIFGAVLATGGAPVFSMLLLSGHFRKKQNHFYFMKKMPEIRTLGRIVPLGVPSLITEVSSGIVMLVFNFVILGLAGNVGVAAYGIIANLSLVVLSVYTGIAEGMQPLVSTCYGKGDQSGTKQVLCYGIILLLVLSAMIFCGMFLLAEPVVCIFNSEGNEALQALAVPGLRYYFTGIAFAGFNIVVSVFFGSIDRAVPAQTISLLRGFVLIVPMTFLMAKAGGITGVWLTFPIVEAIVSIVAVMIYIKQNRR